MLKPTLSGMQSVIGLLAGIFSVVGGVYTGVQYFHRAQDTGELVTVIHDARTDRPVTGPNIEILGADDAIVTTLGAGDSGQVRTRLREGTYRVRVTHPRYTPDTRRVRARPDGGGPDPADPSPRGIWTACGRDGGHTRRQRRRGCRASHAAGPRTLI